MLTQKEKIVYETLKYFVNKDIKPTMVMMRKKLGNNGLTMKSNNSLCQYYIQLQLKGYIKIIPYQIIINVN